MVATLELPPRYWRSAPSLNFASLCLCLALLRRFEQPPGVGDGNLVVELAVKDEQGRVDEAYLVYGVVFILEMSDSACAC